MPLFRRFNLNTDYRVFNFTSKIAFTDTDVDIFKDDKWWLGVCSLVNYF